MNAPVEASRDDPPARRLLIVVWSAGPDRPDLVAAPLVYAAAARALEIEVALHFVAASARWLAPGVAGAAYTDHARTRTVLDHLRQAKAAGARVYACAMAWAEHCRGEPRIDEADGFAGAATVVGEAVEPGARVMVF